MKKSDEKLTLKLKKSSITRAKAVAKKRGTSVSRMVEQYFDQIAPPAPMASESQLSENLQSLVGILKWTGSMDWKEEYRKHVVEKYSR